MPFHFTLETVLRLRRSQEQVERLKLEAIVAQEAQTRANLRGLVEGSFELHRQFQSRLAGGLAAAEVQIEMEREASVKFARSCLQARLVELEQRRIEQVEAFRQARQNREVVENLRLRRLDAYRIEQGRRQQQEIDDLFLLRRKSKTEE